MKKAFSVHRSKHPRYKFVVRGNIGGKAKANYFNAKGEAESFAEVKNTELLNLGREGVEFPTALRVLAIQANELLAPLGISILDAAKEIARRETARRKSIDFASAIEETAIRKKADGKSADWVTTIRSHGRRFAAFFGQKMVSDITPRDIEDAFANQGEVHPITYNNRLGVLTTIFAYSKSRGYCSDNPAIVLKLKKAPDVPPGVLTPEQVSFVLNNAPAELVPYLAVAFFAGIRSAELERLLWSEIDLESGLIEVPATKSKSARRRLVKIEPCLDSWLRPFAQKTGRLYPPNGKSSLKTFRNSYPQLGAWPKNAARHSFCSYHLAHFNDAAKLALEMGHTSTSLIFEHYRKVVRPAEAAKFWQIVRPAEGEQPTNQVRKPWEVPPYSLHGRDDTYALRYYVKWKKKSYYHRKYFASESEARAWMYEQNAPWYEGKSLPEADERRRIERKIQPRLPDCVDTSAAA